MGNTKDNRVKARLPRGFADRGAAEIRAVRRMLDRIREVYERYGFEPVETPAIEYTDALGKFLPDQDRPGEGVFSFQDEDEQWLSLRYDLTAPLARYVAENFDALPKPYRSYRVGWVFRNEKPGPGRYRQFMQFDADTVGSASPAADAEMCMMAADAMEALGIPRGSYVVKLNNRKILEGVLESIGLTGEQNAGRRLTVLRALDKYDRLGESGVRALLGSGRKDESGDVTPGAGLEEDQINKLIAFTSAANSSWLPISPESSLPTPDELIVTKERLLAGLPTEAFDAAPSHSYFSNDGLLKRWSDTLASSRTGQEGISELREMLKSALDCGYGSNRIRIASDTVRGLEYYTGPVYEVDLTFETDDDEGRQVRFGSVGGGGRYDGLVARFRGESVPATGFSIGVSRLAAALAHIGKSDAKVEAGPVVVLVLDRERIGDYQRFTKELRDAGIRAEMYLGESGMRAQMKYADRRGAPCVVIQGSEERAKSPPEVQIKDLIEGQRAAAAIASHQEWRESRPAQFAIAEDRLVDAVREVLRRHGVNGG
jgi:histidyl-tRNA synthetase